MIRFAPALFALVASSALAEIPDTVARIEVIPGWRTADGGQVAALRVTLAPGWKTYWRAPGDAGIPPVFDWQGSQNLTGVAFHWPTPEIFDLNGTQTFGYHDSLVLPLDISLTDGAAPTRLAGSVDLGVCLDICVPVSLTFDAELPTTTTRDPAIVAALTDQPIPGADAGAGQVICTAKPIFDGLRVTAAIPLSPTGGEETVVIEAGVDSIWTSAATATRDGNLITAVADMVPVTGAAFALDRSAVRITVFGTDRVVDIRGCVGG